MSFLSQLNPQQREAVETTEGPVLILAGAGSGKISKIVAQVNGPITTARSDTDIIVTEFGVAAVERFAGKVAEGNAAAALGLA